MPRPLLSQRAEERLGPRHRQVLDQLEQLFLEEGFAGISVRELAANVGCSRRTLYELAPSKDELVLVVLDRFLHRVGRTARAGRAGRAVTIVTQYDVEIYQRIEHMLGTKLEAFDAPQDEALLLMERVGEAQRYAAMEARSGADKRKAGGKRPRDGRGDDGGMGGDDGENPALAKMMEQAARGKGGKKARR